MALTDNIRWSKRKPSEEKLTRPRGGPRRRLPAGNQGGANQKVVVQIRYKPAASLERHASYLQREGAGIDGAKPELFTAEERSVDIEPIKNEKYHFRAIISPENGDKIKDMQSYVRDVMKDAEKELGTKLNWTAAVHQNTDHPHAHVVIRGLDESGHQLRLDRDFVKSGMRELATERANQELGYRSEKEIQQGKERMMDTRANKLTRTDKGLKVEGNKCDPETDQEKRRLQYLERLKLAKQLDKYGRHFEMATDWKDRLREIGKNPNEIVLAPERKHNTQEVAKERAQPQPAREKENPQKDIAKKPRSKDRGMEL